MCFANNNVCMQRISTALTIGHMLYDQGHEYAVSHPQSTYQAIESMIQTLEGSATSGHVYHRRQN